MGGIDRDRDWEGMREGAARSVRHSGNASLLVYLVDAENSMWFILSNGECWGYAKGHSEERPGLWALGT